MLLKSLYTDHISKRKERPIMKQRKNINQRLERFNTSLSSTKPISEEEEIMLDHDYDGIKELDNDLPPWWFYMFYGTILFAVVYLGYYEVFDGKTK